MISLLLFLIVLLLFIVIVIIVIMVCQVLLPHIRARAENAGLTGQAGLSGERERRVSQGCFSRGLYQ